MQLSSPTDGLPSLSTTSPINNTNTTEDTLVLLSDNSLPRTRKQSKSDANTRQRRIAATQAAKREVLANIKEDWTWPTPSAGKPGTHFPRRKDSTQWRERESDSSPTASRSPSPGSRDPYRFESPDAVAPAFAASRAKRRKLMQEEMQWNEGLRVFSERRDCWTGAEVQQPAMPVHEREQRLRDISIQPVTFSATTSANGAPEDLATRSETAVTADASTAGSDTSTPVSSQSLDASTSAPSSTPLSTRTSQSSGLTTPRTTVFSTITPSALPFELTVGDTSPPPPPTLIPLAPPLLSSTAHPDLADITPALYPTIYSKCVVQSLAPSFPINLKDVVGSLVQGWQEDGEWPPKSTAMAEGGKIGGIGMGTGKRDSLREKMRGLRVDGGGGEEPVRFERVARRSVGKVKRALGR